MNNGLQLNWPPALDVRERAAIALLKAQGFVISPKASPQWRDNPHFKAAMRQVDAVLLALKAAQK
jgi:hypothetical protein